MIKLVSENSLKYEDGEGNELEIKLHICSEHGGEIKYIEVGNEKIPVFVPAIEKDCKTWRKEIGIQQCNRLHLTGD